MDQQTIDIQGPAINRYSWTCGQLPSKTPAQRRTDIPGRFSAVESGPAANCIRRHLHSDGPIFQDVPAPETSCLTIFKDLRPVAFEDTCTATDTRPIFSIFRRGLSGPEANTAEKTRKGTDPDILSVPARLKLDQKPI